MKTFYKNFKPYIVKYKGRFLISILAGITTAACTAWGAYLIKPALDDVFIKKDAQMLMIIPALIVLSYIGKSGGMYLQSYLMTYIGQDIVRKIRTKLMSHILTFEMDFFNKKRSGEIMSRIMSDTGAIQAAVSSYVAELFRESVTLVALLCVAIYQNPKLALIGIVVIPMSLIPINAIAKKIKKFSGTLMNQGYTITSKLNEVFNSSEIVKASNGEKLEAKEFDNSTLKMFKISMRSIKYGQLTTPVMEILGAIMIGFVIYVGGKEVIDGSMTSGEFVSFTAALFMVYTPFKKLTSSYVGMQGAIVAGNRIFEMLDRKPAIIDGDKVFSGEVESIKFNNVSLKYDDVAALNDINLSFAKNEVVVLKGKSGSGKSSLVNMILRLYEPSKGEILINNTPLRDYTQHSIRDSIAIVTQRIFVFNDTIAANVAYGSQIDEDRVIDALKKALAWEFVESLPNGIYTEINESGANLSGGQRQRIAIARAIYKDPQILIFDEATSALDEKTEDLLKQTIEMIKKDKIVIIITHRPSTISLATKIVEIENGEILGIIDKTQ